MSLAASCQVAAHHHGPVCLPPGLVLCASLPFPHAANQRKCCFWRPCRLSHVDHVPITKLLTWDLNYMYKNNSQSCLLSVQSNKEEKLCKHWRLEILWSHLDFRSEGWKYMRCTILRCLICIHTPSRNILSPPHKSQLLWAWEWVPQLS